MGAVWLLISRAADLAALAQGAAYNIGNTAYLHGLRSTLGAGATAIPSAIRTALINFFLLFVLRVVLRNQWLAVVAFVGLYLVTYLPGQPYPWINAIVITANFSLAAFVLTRFGLLAFAAGVFVDDLLDLLPVTTNTAAPYFPQSVLTMAIALALCIWAFRTSIAGSRLWRADLLDSV
jgi:hypothetical protein